MKYAPSRFTRQAPEEYISTQSSLAFLIANQKKSNIDYSFIPTYVISKCLIKHMISPSFKVIRKLKFTGGITYGKRMERQKRELQM